MGISINYVRLSSNSSLNQPQQVADHRRSLTEEKTIGTFHQFNTQMEYQAAGQLSRQENELSSLFFLLQCDEDRDRLAPLNEIQKIKVKGWLDGTNRSLSNEESLFLLMQPMQWGLSGQPKEAPRRGPIDDQEVVLEAFSCLKGVFIRSDSPTFYMEVPVNQMRIQEIVIDDQNTSRYVLILKRGWFARRNSASFIGHWSMRNFYVSLTEKEISHFFERRKQKRCVIL